MWPLDDGLEPPRRHGGSPADVRALLGGLVPSRALSGSMLFVAAHPEDPVRGASWLLRRGPGAHVVHVTDEPVSFEALWLAGLPQDRLLFLGATEQEASQHLVTLTECMLALLKALRPSLLVVPPYGGGHPDWDASAFITHAAVALLVRGGRTPPALLEMTGTEYRSPLEPEQPTVTAPLTGPEYVLKQRMLSCYPPRDGEPSRATAMAEAYRLAPHYDFIRPPREGFLLEPALHWRRRAHEALETLKLADAFPH